MPFELAKNWWALVLRGIVGLVLGVVAFTRPVMTIAVLVSLFGAYALLDGALSIIAAWRASRSHEPWGPFLVEGIVGIGIGLATFFWPGVTLLILLLMIATWAVLKGVFEVLAAIRLRKLITGEWLLALGGIMSILFGVIVFSAPLVGAVALSLWVGSYAFVFGVVLIALGLRLRHWIHHPLHPATSH
jgi:uncharacterized membrane protein HdeD (DUF308 family)